MCVHMRLTVCLSDYAYTPAWTPLTKIPPPFNKTTPHRRTFRVDGVSWIAGHPPAALLAHRRQSSSGAATDTGIPLEVQVRHGPNSHPDARVRARDDACTSVEVTLGREDSLAPGQYAAFYQGGVDCLGAGVISEETFAVPQRPARRPIVSGG